LELGTSDDSPIDLRSAFEDVGMAGRLLELVVRLRRAAGGGAPRVDLIRIGWACDVPIG